MPRLVGLGMALGLTGCGGGGGSTTSSATTITASPSAAGTRSDDGARTPSDADGASLSQGRNPRPVPRSAPTPDRALRRLVGQKFMVAFRGVSTPPEALLTRVGRGEVGGVILFSENASIATVAGFRRTATILQRAARKGGNPPLLIATDQEGGAVRRLPGPPRAAPASLATTHIGAVSALGAATGHSLRTMGVNVDLAPVADVVHGSGSFLASRAYGSNTSAISRSVAFADGLQRAHVAATAKHYPGLGRSGQANTDVEVVRVGAPRAPLDSDRVSFFRHARSGTRLVMVSSAIYPAYDRQRPAVLSSTVLRPLRARYDGVVVSDDLTTPALRPYGRSVPRMATAAGVDLLLYASSDGVAPYQALLEDARASRVARSQITEQVRRIVRLKMWLTSTN